MNNNSNKYFQNRREKFYDQETRSILNQIVLKHPFPYLFFITRISLSKKGESLKIYLNFFNHSQELVKIDELNKIYPQLIKKKMASSKKFSYLPNITFQLDKNWEKQQELERIAEEITINNE